MHAKLHFSRGKSLSLASQNILLEISVFIEIFMEALQPLYLWCEGVEGVVEKGDIRKNNCMVFYASGNICKYFSSLLYFFPFLFDICTSNLSFK